MGVQLSGNGQFLILKGDSFGGVGQKWESHEKSPNPTWPPKFLSNHNIDLVEDEEEFMSFQLSGNGQFLIWPGESFRGQE